MANDIELWVFDMDFNRLAIIDTYNEVSLVTKYQDHSDFSVIVEGTKTNADLFLSDVDRIIVKSNDIYRGYYVETPQYTDEKSVEIELICRSLSVMMAWRIIKGQQRFTGNIENVIKSFINANGINTDGYRKIPNLVLGANEGINISVDETYTNYQLDTAIWEMCVKYDIGFEILMNHDAKKYVVSTFAGVNRSTSQTINPHIIFSKEFENVNKQSYVDDKADYKSTAYVEAEDRALVLNNVVSGFARRELYVDATSISKTYNDEEGNEITIPDSEFVQTVTETGNSKLAEYPRVRTFETEIDTNSQYRYNKDYFIGDVVTNRNDELGIVTHARVVTAHEVWNRDGYSLELEFGTAIPQVFEKVKREIKNTSSGGSGKGSNGVDGVGIEYVVEGSTFGIKREDEADYTYMTLQGERGPKGDKGADGISITHSWSGTTLTVTSANGTSSANLKGDKGDVGPQGIQGPQGERGLQGIQGAQGPKGDKGDTGQQGPIGLTGPKGDTGPQGLQGPKGDKPAHQWSGTSLRFENPNGTYGSYVNLKGDRGDVGPTGPQGERGLQGVQGPKGDVGLQGPQGLKGDTGPVGPQGIQGPKGDKGDVGERGPQGLQGPAGSDANVTSVNVISALGYTPTKSTDITWGNVLNKPNTFTPSSHSHDWADILNKPLTFTPSTHTHTKSEVGLGNVQNYGIATQAEAEAGTSNAKYVTPLRVKQAIDKNKPTKLSDLVDDIGASGGDNIMVIGGIPYKYNFTVDENTGGLVFGYEEA